MEEKSHEKKNKNYKWYKDGKIFGAFIMGLGLGLIILAITFPERIAKLENGEEVVVSFKGHEITANNIYDDMKESYSIEQVLNTIDETILNEKYKLNEDQTQEINEQIDYYLEMYKTNYGIEEADFYKQNGWETREEFFDVLSLDYRKMEYVKEYLGKDITDKQKQDYFDKYIIGSTNVSYITVALGSTDEEKSDNKSLAEKISKRVKNNESYSEITKAYKDNSAVTGTDSMEITYEDSLDKAVFAELNNLKDNTSSKKYVETSNGYVIVFKGTSKDKPKIDDVKDIILERMVNDILNENSNKYYQALINMRNEAEIKFYDTKFDKDYVDYIEKVNK